MDSNDQEKRNGRAHASCFACLVKTARTKTLKGTPFSRPPLPEPKSPQNAIHSRGCQRLQEWVLPPFRGPLGKTMISKGKETRQGTNHPGFLEKKRLSASGFERKREVSTLDPGVKGAQDKQEVSLTETERLQKEPPLHQENVDLQPAFRKTAFPEPGSIAPESPVKPEPFNPPFPRKTSSSKKYPSPLPHQ